MKKLIRNSLIGATMIGFVGCSTGNLPSPKYEEPRKSTQYSLENILPEKYKSMDLVYVGTTPETKLGDDPSLNNQGKKEGDYRTGGYVTAIYRDKNRELSSEENEARKMMGNNLRVIVKNADYSLMIFYQICSDEQKPVRMYAPYDDGANWVFKEGEFHRDKDLMVKFKEVVQSREKFKSMNPEERKKAWAIINPTFANCGYEIKAQGNHHSHHGHGGGHHGKGHGDHH